MRLFMLMFMALCALSSCGKAPRGTGALDQALRAFEAGDWSRVQTLLGEGGAGETPEGLLLAGKALFFSGETAAAERKLERAARAMEGGRGGAVEANLFLVRALREEGKSGEARSLCGRLLSSSGADLRVLRLAASLALDANETASALSLLNRAVSVGVELGLARLDRARLRWAAGDGDGARADISSALELLPQGSAAHTAAASLLTALPKGPPSPQSGGDR